MDALESTGLNKIPITSAQQNVGESKLQQRMGKAEGERNTEKRELLLR